MKNTMLEKMETTARYLWMYCCIIGLVLFPLLTFGQNATLKVNSKTNVEIGEQFRVVYELNADGSSFTGPDFQNFSVVTGPMVSTNSSIQVINGKMDRSFTQTYTYIIRANREGNFTIGTASVMVDGKKITSDKIAVSVVPASASNAAQSAGSTSGQNNQNAGGLSPKDLYLRAIPDKRSAVVGEQIIVTYRIYTRVPVSSLSVTKLSSFPGFWTKNLLKDNDQLQQSTQIIDGQEYVLADIRKVALFPQKPGKLTIEPMELECVAQIRTQGSSQRSRDPFESFFNDPFFNRNIQNIPKTLVSESVTIDVEPVPAARRPQQYNGAVGQFGFQAAINRTSLLANEAANLTLTVTGSGNIELIDLPQPVFPPDFEVYDPKVSTDIRVGPSGVNGTKKAEYLIIPRFQGDYTIPSIGFSFYDPKKKEYINLSSQAFELTVEKGDTDANTDAMMSRSQEGIRYIGSDIRHIQTDQHKLRAQDRYFFASLPYYLINLLIVLVFSSALVFSRRQDRLRQNQSLLKNRKATKVAKKRLKAAELSLKKKDQNAFYAEMSQALWGYIADKFMIPLSELSFESVQTELLNKQVDQALTDELIQALNNCEYARFAPGDTGKKMEDLYLQGIEVITKAERSIK